MLITGKTGNIYKQKFKNKKKTNQRIFSYASLFSLLLSLLLLISSHFFSSKPATRNPGATKQNPMEDPRKKKQSYSIPSPVKPTIRNPGATKQNPMEDPRKKKQSYSIPSLAKPTTRSTRTLNPDD